MPNVPQLDFYRAFARTVTPVASRPSPQVWFRQLVIMRKLDAAPESLVRRIPLRRGLNVLWAQPEDPTKEVRMYEDGLSGHASGKTLFCRLLRYLLGEENYGNEMMQDAVARKFDELWVLAEVMVGTELWLAVRPMTPSLHKFAIKGVTVEEYLRDQPAHGRFDDYLTAIEEATCGALVGREEANELFRWRYLLPWLTRDQECRFADLNDWRSSLSQAEAPQTSVAEQQLLVRAVLDLLDADEQRMKQELEKVEKDLKQATESTPGAEKEWRKDMKHLLPHLQRLNITGKEGDSLEELAKRATKFQEGVEEAIRIANEDAKLKATQADWQAKRDARVKVDGRIEQLKRDLVSTEQRWKEVVSKRQAQRERGLTNPARAEAGFCPRTLADAVERGCCKLPEGASLQTNMELGGLQEESDWLKKAVEEKKAEIARMESSVERLEAAQQAAWNVYQKEVKRVENSTEGLRRKVRDAETAQERLEEAKESFDEVGRLKAILKTNGERQDELKRTLKHLRDSHDTARQVFSELFADAVRAVMGSQVSAKATLSERGISLQADRNGELYGAALDTIKVLAFDIAAMTASLEGRGHHPRFLIHDGPREADMERVVYERFFLYARKLEDSFPAGTEPSFQYIVTTTTPPPHDMQFGSKWLLDPVMDASKKEGRLLKEDL